MNFDHTRALRGKPTYRRLYIIATNPELRGQASTIGDQEALGLNYIASESVAQTLLRALDLAIERDSRDSRMPDYSPRD